MVVKTENLEKVKLKNTFINRSNKNYRQPVQILFPPYSVGNLAVLAKNTRMSGSFYSYENYKAYELYNFCIVGKGLSFSRKDFPTKSGGNKSPQLDRKGACSLSNGDYMRVNGRVRASAAIKEWYYKKLMSLIDEMNKSVLWWLGARYKENEKEIVAQDSASGDIEDELKKLMRRWRKRFDEASKDIAKDFVKKSTAHSTNNLKALLKKAGWTTNLKLSRHAQDKLKALMIENINLIKSIENKYFDELITVTMESITRGRDLAYLAEQIAKRYKVSKDRAMLIARDQNNKATSIITHIEYEELGIKEAIWKHNPGSKEPRHTHIEANNKVYDINKGLWFKDKELHIFPGQEINCGCTSEPIIPEIRELQLKRLEKR